MVDCDLISHLCIVYCILCDNFFEICEKRCNAFINMCHPGSGFPCWCRSRSGSGLALQRCQSSEYFFIFSHSIVSLQCFIFIFSVKCTIIFSVFFTHYWNFLEKSQVYQLFNLLGLDTDPDRHSLDADPDPAKWCGSGSTTQLDNVFLVNVFQLFFQHSSSQELYHSLKIAVHRGMDGGGSGEPWTKPQWLYHINTGSHSKCVMPIGTRR